MCLPTYPSSREWRPGGACPVARAAPATAGRHADSVYTVTALSDLLAAANEGRSARALAREARERGHTLNHDTAARYLRGDHGVPDEATLVAFADILGLKLRDLRAAADLPTDSTEAYQPPPEASRLTRRQRRAVDEIIRAMVEPVRAGGEVRELPAQRRAARHGDPEPSEAD